MQNVNLKDYENLYNKLRNREGADWTRPPENYKQFLKETQELFVRKSTDYDDRFIKGMIDLGAKAIWSWEVDKKLDRIRSWITRGELQVKGEGLRNSVDDLFVYTVQFFGYLGEVGGSRVSNSVFLDTVRKHRRAWFDEITEKTTAVEWVKFLVATNRIGKDELLLQNMILLYMGHDLSVEDWQSAIKSLLS